MPNLFLTLGGLWLQPRLHQTGNGMGAHAEIFRHKHSQRPCLLSPSGPVLIQLKVGERVEWSYNERHHPSCWDGRDTGIDIGESRRRLWGLDGPEADTLTVCLWQSDRVVLFSHQCVEVHCDAFNQNRNETETPKAMKYRSSHNYNSASNKSVLTVGKLSHLRY